MLNKPWAIYTSIFAVLFISTSSWADWNRSYVVEWYEPAFYYGAESGESEPGSDCPAGTNPDLDWRSVLKTSYRTEADIDVIMDPEKPLRARVAGTRGPNKENVYKEPWVVPDPGMVGVTGDIAFGFDLDGKSSTGFKRVDGKGKGVDNQYYKTAGCWMSWRAPSKQSHHAKYVNDGMRDGAFSIVLVVSGSGDDPANDKDVSVGFYLAKDRMVKDANGNIAQDYTFRINPDPRFQSVIQAKTVNNQLLSTEQKLLKLRHLETAPFFPPQLLLHNAKIRIDNTEEGSIAWLGGYRPIVDYYRGWAASGAIHELVTHVNMVGYWYSLRRHADYLPDDSGQNTAISTAYRMFLTPAIVVTPTADAQVTVAKIFPGEVDPKIGARRFSNR